MEKQLSIIIPLYNAKNYLANLSVVLSPVVDKQSIEIVLINDGSTDNTFSLAEEMANQYNNVILLNKANGGAASARNVGIKEAKGKYIAFLDADDKMDFEQLALLLEKTNNQTLDICAFDLRYIDKSGHQKGEGLLHSITYNAINTGQFYLNQGYQPSSICVFLVKRTFIVDNDLFFHEGITHEDVELSFRWMLHAQKVMFTKEVIYYYYQHDGSVTNQINAPKKKSYLMDEVKIAALMKNQKDMFKGKDLQTIIEKNYNAVVWNLLYSLYTDTKLLDRQFVEEVMAALRNEKLYPIKGALKTKFQGLSKYLMNIENIYKFLVFKKMIQN